MGKLLFIFITAIVSSAVFADAEQDYKDAISQAVRSGNATELRRLVDQGPPKEEPASLKPQSAAATSKPLESNASRYYGNDDGRTYENHSAYPTEHQRDLQAHERARRSTEIERVTDEADFDRQALRKAEIAARKAQLQEQEHERTMRALKELNDAQLDAIYGTPSHRNRRCRVVRGYRSATMTCD